MSTSAKEKHAAAGYEEFAEPGMLRWSSEVAGQELPVWLDLDLMGKSTLSPKGESFDLLTFVYNMSLDHLLRLWSRSVGGRTLDGVHVRNPVRTYYCCSSRALEVKTGLPFEAKHQIRPEI